MKYRTLYYPLLLVPTLTELLESGRWPEEPRSWLSNIIMTLIVALLIWLLHRREQRLVELSETDGLTGLKNRRVFEINLPSEVWRAQRMNTGLTLTFIDIDHFKRVNDRHGHHKGDEVLRELAQLILESMRQDTDNAYRIGGDEFALLMPHEQLATAARINERLEKIIKTANQALFPVGASLSLGVAHLDAQESADAFLKRADRLMYAEKRGQCSNSLPQEI